MMWVRWVLLGLQVIGLGFAAYYVRDALIHVRRAEETLDRAEGGAR